MWLIRLSNSLNLLRAMMKETFGLADFFSLRLTLVFNTGRLFQLNKCKYREKYEIIAPTNRNHQPVLKLALPLDPFLLGNLK